MTYLDLVDCGRPVFGVRLHLFKMMRPIVAHTNVLCFPLVHEPLQNLPHHLPILWPRSRCVNKEKVDIAVLTGVALANALNGALICVLRLTTLEELCGDKDLLPWQLGFLESLPDFSFVSVALCRINVAIACVEGVETRRNALICRRTEDAEAELGHLSTGVLESDGV